MRRCSVHDIGFDLYPKQDTEQEHLRVGHTMRAVDQYLHQFAAPEITDTPHPFLGVHLCQCGKLLDGVQGTFQPSEFGEGSCSACGTPVRMVHKIEDEQGRLLAKFIYPLVFHPDTPVTV